MTNGADDGVSTEELVSTDGVSREVAVCGSDSVTLFGAAAGIIRGAAENIEREAGLASPASFTWTWEAAVFSGASRRTSS
jgi:hypothetical protein